VAAALVGGVLTFERHARIPSFRPASYLGDASYSIYLWHAMAISVAAKLGSVLLLPKPIVFGIAIVSGVAVGVAAHEILEKPIAAFLKDRRGRRSRASFAA
jgi:exopolysaccharide production protein ExoZ